MTAQSVTEAVAALERRIRGRAAVKPENQAEFDAALSLLREQAERAASLEAELEKARYLGDNHHNAAACPYCGDLIGKEKARTVAAEARAASLRDALEPFTEYDFHATQWIAGLKHDGHELRAIHAEDVEKLIGHVRAARAALAPGSEGET